MGWEHLFLGFLQPVALGVAAVLLLLLALSFGTRRHVASVGRKSAHRAAGRLALCENFCDLSIP